jgi:hypothetical protein
MHSNKCSSELSHLHFNRSFCGLAAQCTKNAAKQSPTLVRNTAVTEEFSEALTCSHDFGAFEAYLLHRIGKEQEAKSWIRQTNF